MKIPQKIIPALLVTGWLSGATAFAGSFTTTFADYTGFSFGGVGADIYTNRAVLTSALNNQSGSLTLDDLDGGQAIESFTATFKLQIGPVTAGTGADGVSFNFGPEIYPGLVTSEEGPGGSALTIAFDTYDNGLAAEGHPSPSLDIRFAGATIATHPYAKSDMVTSKLEDVSVQLKKNGTVSVSYKGQVVFTDVFVPGWGPTNGIFNFSARTGGENEEADIANLTINTVLMGPAVAPTITAAPQSVTVNEGNSTNFTVWVDGTAPFSFQWQKNNQDIQDATSATLVMGPIHYVDNGAKIKVKVTNPANTATSAEATLTVIRDTTAPTLVKANTDTAGATVTVVFSEPVSDTALAAGNYTIDQGVSVTSVTRVNASTVMLTTSQMPQGRIFTLTINGVQDTASSPPNTILANTKVQFSSYQFQVGAVLHKKYANFDNSNAGQAEPNNLFNDPRYPNNPDRQELMPMWEYPLNGAYRDQNTEPDGTTIPPRGYFDTLEGYFMPATTADYVFIIAGADDVWLYLSTDEDPANKHLVAHFAGWTNPREWLLPQANNPHENDAQTNNMRTDLFANTQWPDINPDTFVGARISMQAGKKYYMLSIHHDDTWSGADDFATTFILTNVVPPAAGTAPALTGNVVGTYLDPTGAKVTFSQQPTDVTVVQGRGASFTAAATGQSVYGTNVTWQWQTAPKGSTTFTNIPGATSASYTAPVLPPSESGRQYQALATVPGFTQPSSIATLTITADSTPPHLVAASAIASQTGATFDVGVTFDEPLDPASATNSANYTISGATVSAVKYYAQSPGVVLTVSGLTAGGNYTVTVTNAADPYGNHMTSASLPLTVSAMKWGTVGADELGLGSGVVAVSPNAFDIYSDGVGEWAAYDEATFVYEQITGDFDREVRVEYVDPASQWARAGLIVRDVPNFGVTRAAQTGSGAAAPPFDGSAGRYQKIHVQPVITAMGTPGANDYEGNRRLDTGGPTSGAPGVGGTPQYPNAWCRLQRVGQTFTVFRSADGVNWTRLGSTTWGVDDTNHIVMPNTLYVGPEYAPENGNVNPTSLRRMFGAKFRDYRAHSNALPAPNMTWQKTPTGMTITFEGTLEGSDTLANGSWSTVSTTSPYSATTTGAKKFYRAKR